MDGRARGARGQSRGRELWSCGLVVRGTLAISTLLDGHLAVCTQLKVSGSTWNFQARILYIIMQGVPNDELACKSHARSRVPSRETTARFYRAFLFQRERRDETARWPAIFSTPGGGPRAGRAREEKATPGHVGVGVGVGASESEVSEVV